MIDWELVEWGKEDHKSEDEKDPHWIVMVLSMAPIYTLFIFFVVWCLFRVKFQ